MHTIQAIADRAVTDPSSLSEADKVRLGAWVLDHEEHVASHHRLVGQRPPAPAGSLVARMAPSAPPAALAPGPVTDPALIEPADTLTEVLETHTDEAE